MSNPYLQTGLRGVAEGNLEFPAANSKQGIPIILDFRLSEIILRVLIESILFMLGLLNPKSKIQNLFGCPLTRHGFLHAPVNSVAARTSDFSTLRRSMDKARQAAIRPRQPPMRKAYW